MLQCPINIERLNGLAAKTREQAHDPILLVNRSYGGIRLHPSSHLSIRESVRPYIHPYITLHYTKTHYITLQHVTIRYNNTLQNITIHTKTYQNTPIHTNTSKHYISVILPYIHYITLHYMTRQDMT